MGGVAVKALTKWLHPMWQSRIMASAELSSALNTGHNSFTNNALCYFALHDTNVGTRPLCRVAVAVGAKWSMNALACAMPTTRTSMEGRGKVVKSAVISGRPGITNSMRRIPSTGPDIETRRQSHEVHITGTKNDIWKAFLDTL